MMDWLGVWMESHRLTVLIFVWAFLFVVFFGVPLWFAMFDD